MRNPSRQIRAHQRRTAPGKSARAPTAIRARRRWYQKARDSREQKAANDQHLILEEERFSNSTSPQATASRRFCGVIPSPDVIRGLWRPLTSFLQQAADQQEPCERCQTGEPT